MDPLSPLPAILILFVAVVVAYFMSRYSEIPPDQGRFVALDGLRGYLALFVFLYHSALWYFYLRTGQWEVPPSNLYTHFGQSSVLLFFMITGFLFFSKLLDGRMRGIDWLKLFIGRLLRLVPLYLFMIVLLCIIVMVVSGWVLHEPLLKIAEHLVCWLGFTILGAPDLNGVKDTLLIVSGVIWTLPYEWLFYLILPVLAITVRVVPPLLYIVLSVGSIVTFIIYNPQTHPVHPQLHPLFSFFGGIAASLLVRSDSFRWFCRKDYCSFLVIGLIIAVVALFQTAYAIMPLIIISLIFSLIAGGNSLFGVLRSSISRVLGELSYSIYLLHGMALFILFKFVVGPNHAELLSAQQHWMLVLAISPVILFISYWTFRLIEQPAMRATNTVTAWLSSRLTWRFRTYVVSVEPKA